MAKLINAEARELEALGVDVIQLDEPAFNVYLDEDSHQTAASTKNS